MRDSPENPSSTSEDRNTTATAQAKHPPTALSAEQMSSPSLETKLQCSDSPQQPGDPGEQRSKKTTTTTTTATATMEARPSVRCFREAAKDSALLCDREFLAQCYLDEIKQMQMGAEEPSSHVPAHVPVLEQNTASKTVRILQWNVNVLHGADNVHFALAQPAERAAKVIEGLNADVVLLQEAWQLAYPEGKSPPWPNSASRVQDLLRRLRGMGYQLIATEPVHNNFNPCVLATKLPVLRTGGTFSTDKGHEFAGDMLASRIPELRAARLVELGLTPEGTDPLAPTITTVITHFHHNEGPAASRGFGIRRGEAAAIVAECNKWHEARENTDDSAPTATILATDFNGVRKRDFNAVDWELQQKCMQRLKQPLEDGVAGLLEQNGFKCTYDQGRGSVPAFTHWTNTVLDFAYLRQESATQSATWSVKGTHVVPTDVSDHLPVVHDIAFHPKSPQPPSPVSVVVDEQKE